MRIHAAVLAAVLGLVLSMASGARAAEMPSVSELPARMGFPAATVTVYEPHLSLGDDRHVVDYVGYRAADVLSHLFGADWSGQAETVEFRALDGWVSRIDIERFLEEDAFIVFARKDNSPFMIDNPGQNETDVPLAPYYLVWDNISNPGLLAEERAQLALSGGGGEPDHPLGRGAVAGGARPAFA